LKNKKIIVAGVLTALLGVGVFVKSDLIALQNPTLDQDSRLNSLAKFTKVVATIQKYYVDELSVDDIVKKALQGLLSNLDAHSSYLDEKGYKDLKIDTEGQFGGTGHHLSV